MIRPTRAPFRCALHGSTHVVPGATLFDGQTACGSHEAGCEIRYSILGREDRGKAYGGQAPRILSAYLFKLKPIAGLQALTINDNIPTRRIADKCGYEVEPPGDAAVKESQR